MDDIDARREAARKAGSWSNHNGKYRDAVMKRDEAAMAGNLTAYLGASAPVIPAPVAVNRAVYDCVRHIISQNMVRNAFDVQEVLDVMKRVRMNKNAIRWIDANREDYARGVMFGFTVREGGRK